LKLDKNQDETNLPMKILFFAYFACSSRGRSMVIISIYVQKPELPPNLGVTREWAEWDAVWKREKLEAAQSA
jgi:hypothetical protein